MVTVTSLYICISYIYTYSYNFYYLSSLHSYCMSIFSVICSMSLAYLLSILLLYSCFYTLHIPYSFYNLLFFMFYYIFFHILLYFHIFSILFMCSSFMLLFIAFHVLLHILSYNFVLYILSILFMSSYTVFLVLVTVYYHRIAVLCFSYHIMYFIHFLYL